VHCFTDTQPPEFIDEECPHDIIRQIDASNNTALVSWDIPHGKDNSGKAPLIVEVHNLQPNSRFTAGAPHLVKYTITDDAGNVGRSCEFTITVECTYVDVIFILIYQYLYHTTVY